MLKNQTIKDLEKVFNVDNELSELEVLPAGGVEVVNLDLIRVHINARGSSQYINRIVEILKKNQEPGPLRIHEEAATSCNLLFYIDICSI